jgi:hypothetical protein
MVQAASFPDGNINPYNKSFNNNLSPFNNFAEVPFMYKKKIVNN